MSRVGALSGSQWGFGASRAQAPHERWIALAAVAVAHVAVTAGFALAELNRPAPPAEPVIEVSFIEAAPAGQAAGPPQADAPAPPPPEQTLIATPRSTPSAMTAPPVEREQPPQRPVAVQAAPPIAAPAMPAPAAPAPADSSGATAEAPPAVIPPSFTAAYLNNPGPAYPMASRRKREQGVVRLRVQVGADGEPSQVLLDRSSGFRDLDAAALDVVKKRWRFAPAKQGDRLVSAWVIVPLAFELKDR